MEEKISINNLNVDYGKSRAVKDISMKIPKNKVTALIGPSGCGKSTLIRCLNRMNDYVDDCKVTGSIELDGVDITKKQINLVDLRRRVGMVFQKPNPFPFSIYENVVYGLRRGGIRKRQTLENVLIRSLKRAALYDELKDRLDDDATGLSGGQQQRLCIARALSMEPEVLLMDEPCSALDPISTAKIEELVMELKKDCTIVIVTHNIEQARRISDRTVYLHLGKIIEDGRTESVFTKPKKKKTRNYLSGKFG